MILLQNRLFKVLFWVYSENVFVWQLNARPFNIHVVLDYYYYSIWDEIIWYFACWDIWNLDEVDCSSSWFSVFYGFPSLNLEQICWVTHMSLWLSCRQCLITFFLQDTAGQERFHALGPIYYCDADGMYLINTSSVSFMNSDLENQELLNLVFGDYVQEKPHYMSLYWWLQQCF